MAGQRLGYKIDLCPRAVRDNVFYVTCDVENNLRESQYSQQFRTSPDEDPRR